MTDSVAQWEIVFAIANSSRTGASLSRDNYCARTWLFPQLGDIIQRFDEKNEGADFCWYPVYKFTGLDSLMKN